MYPVQLPDAVFDFRQFLREYLSPLLKVRRDFGRSRRRTERAHGFTKRPLAVGVKLEFVAIRGDYCRLSLFQLASQLLHQRQSLLERTKPGNSPGIHDSSPAELRHVVQLMRGSLGVLDRLNFLAWGRCGPAALTPVGFAL